VVVDGRGRVPAHGSLFYGSAPSLIVTTNAAPVRLRQSWENAGVEVLVLDGSSGDRVPLVPLMEALGKRDFQNVLIEGGATLAWAAVEAGVVDRLVLYLAPKLIGGADAPGILGGSGVKDITEALGASIRSVERIGEDLKVVADVHRNR
jgi:diaminohydroxyphosphoribosylaminopyrimidine deaminase/5-amino-6-(5-phosphoribosylamino)uracil reductase